MSGMSTGFLPILRICILVLVTSTVHAEDTAAPKSNVTLAWDKSPDRTVKGYRLHYGVTSGRNYLHVLDVGKATSCKLPDLIPGKKYYFVVTAYNASGIESPPSREIAFTAPKATPTPTP
jgi:fibronectin type III domain protein